jgi:hypothetical protein
MGKTGTTKSVEITGRDLQLLHMLKAAGWLTTRQIQRRFFPGKSANAVCKRLRKLVAGKYLGIVRRSSTECALYRLASQGKLALSEYLNLEPEEITIPTQLPRKLNHFMGINDLRLAFEQLNGERGVKLVSFFSERELCLYRHDSARYLNVLPRLLQSYRIIPDVLARIRITNQGGARDMDVAIEFDAGTEHTGFFGKTKVVRYALLAAKHQNWLEEFKVLTFTVSIRRIVNLMRQVVTHRASPHLFYFAPAHEIEGPGWETRELFLDPYHFFIPVRQGNRTDTVERELEGRDIPRYTLAGLPTTSPHRVSPRGDSQESD